MVAVDPGNVMTELFSREPGDNQMRHLQTVVAPKKSGPVAEGVKNQLWAATAKNVKTGCYYEPVGRDDVARGLALDDELARNL